MSYELTGKLIEKFDVQQVSDSFKKLEFVVEKEENVAGNVYTEVIKFQCVQDKVDMLDNININDIVTISFNIRGRKWEKPGGDTLYFTNLDAWRIEVATAAAEQPAMSTPPAGDEPPPPADADDLPF